MADTGEEVLINNDLVKVVRLRVEGSSKREAPSRGPRVVISLNDEIEVRHQHGGGSEQIRRKAGDAVFRDASSGHTIENQSKDPHTVVIVELKSAS